MKCKKKSTSLDNKSTNNAIDVTNIINEPDTVLIVSIKNDNKETHILKAKISELQNSSLVVKTEKKSYLYIIPSPFVKTKIKYFFIPTIYTIFSRV
jgi:hypothetical protein